MVYIFSMPPDGELVPAIRDVACERRAADSQLQQPMRRKNRTADYTEWAQKAVEAASAQSFSYMVRHSLQSTISTLSPQLSGSLRQLWRINLLVAKKDVKDLAGVVVVKLGLRISLRS